MYANDTHQYIVITKIDILLIDIYGIKLQNGQDRFSGKLQVDVNGMWYETCLSSKKAIKRGLARTVCRELGFWPLRLATM